MRQVMQMQMVVRCVMTSVLVMGFGSYAAAQSQFPPPAGPVTICGTQAPPTADQHQMIFDGGTPESVTLDAPVAACPSGSTHSFTLPASRFTVGTHTIALVATNAFGSTTGPAYTITVGIAPGQFTVTAVVSGD